MSHIGRLRVIRGLAALTGVVLLVIGIRFLLVPDKAARFFGIERHMAESATALNHVVALRDIWLALIVLVLSAAADWRGLALWFGLATGVCFGDAAIAATSSGRAVSIAFHMASGGFCAAMGVACWRRHVAQRRNPADP